MNPLRRMKERRAHTPSIRALHQGVASNPPTTMRRQRCLQRMCSPEPQQLRSHGANPRVCRVPPLVEREDRRQVRVFLGPLEQESRTTWPDPMHCLKIFKRTKAQVPPRPDAHSTQQGEHGRSDGRQAFGNQFVEMSLLNGMQELAAKPSISRRLGACLRDVLPLSGLVVLLGLLLPSAHRLAPLFSHSRDDARHRCSGRGTRH